jgi:hypothetical protein
MGSPDDPVVQRVASLTDEELARMLGPERRDCTGHALAAAKVEAKKRGWIPIPEPTDVMRRESPTGRQRVVRAEFSARDLPRLAGSTAFRSTLGGAACMFVLLMLAFPGDQGRWFTFVIAGIAAACLGLAVGRWGVFWSAALGGAVGSILVHAFAYRYDHHGLCFGLERLLNFPDGSYGGALTAVNYSNHAYPFIDWPVFPIMWLLLGLSMGIFKPLWRKAGWVLLGAIVSGLGALGATRLMIPAAEVLLKTVFSRANSELNCLVIDLAVGAGVFAAGFFPIVLTARYALGKPAASPESAYVQVGTIDRPDDIAELENALIRRRIDYYLGGDPAEAFLTGGGIPLMVAAAQAEEAGELAEELAGRPVGSEPESPPDSPEDDSVHRS